MARAKKTAEGRPALLPNDDPRAGTIEDPNVVDPYAHLPVKPAQDLYRHPTADDLVAELASSSSSSDEEEGDANDA